MRRSGVMLILILLAFPNVIAHEKTLRKMVRDRHKMVQTPFSAKGIVGHATYGVKEHKPDFSPASPSMNKYIIDDPILSPDANTTKYINENTKNDDVMEWKRSIESGSATQNDYVLHDETNSVVFHNDIKHSNKIVEGDTFDISSSYFSSNADKVSKVHEPVVEENFEITPRKAFIEERDRPQFFLAKEFINAIANIPQNKSFVNNKKQENDVKKIEIESTWNRVNYNYTKIITSFDDCKEVPQAETDIDVQMLLSNLDIEPTWVANKKYWDQHFESRYEALMRSTKWPPLKVILMPVAHVDTFSEQAFQALYADKLLTKIVKKLQVYNNFTFTWPEVAQFSRWWKENIENREAILRLIREGRFEITTGGWVQIEEGTSYIFGMLHQLTEGHQWLKTNLNYLPEVAWLTKSVIHSPTIPYVLSASGVTKLVIKNIHFSLEHYMAENQYSDFIWTQNWEAYSGNDATNNIRNSKEDHSVATHYLQFNSDDFGACGPVTEICHKEFDFEHTNMTINEYNIKEKSELLLEQYSKSGTLSSHNVIIVPLGEPYRLERPERRLSKLYNNYLKIADFINLNKDIYKSTLEFGTPKDYFAKILSIHQKYPTMKGEFSNYADIKSGSPVYWTSFYRTRPHLKLLLRYLESNLRSAEILFSFAHSFKVFNTYDVRHLLERLIEIRERTASVQDRNIMSGENMQNVNRLILDTIKDCWHLQEAIASLLSTKSGTNKIYLEKYIYRERDLISPHISVVTSDQLYIFNSLSQERVEIVEFVSRLPNLKVIDHNDIEMELQINPIVQYTTQRVINISRQFYKYIFIATIPPLSFKLFKIEASQRNYMNNVVSTIYCDKCVVETVVNDLTPPFELHSMQKGDIEIENDKFHIIIDERTGLMKIVTDKTYGQRRALAVDYGLMTHSKKNTQIYTFNAYSKEKDTIIISGHIMTEVISKFGNLLQHSIKIFHVPDGPLKHILKLDSRLGHELPPGLEHTEIFLSIQTNIKNGINPEIFVDNNGFQYTSHFVNLSRNIESNMHLMTSLAYIQDKQSRLTVITDHAQGVTSLNEGQIMIMLEKITRHKDNENDMNFKEMTHSHVILLENLIDTEILSKFYQLPSIHANYFTNVMNYLLDVFFIAHDLKHLCQYNFLPLVKTSFPCDVNIINHRMLTGGKYRENKFPSALLTLQKIRFSCKTHILNGIACQRNSRFNLFAIIHNLHDVYKTNLVGTERGLLLNSFDLHNFKPMELMTLRISFEM